MKFKIFLLICFSLTAIFSQNKRALKPEDLYKIVSVSDPQISPDSKWISFTASVPNLEDNKSNSDIWIVSRDGSQIKKLTNSPGADFKAKWLKSGSALVFISDRLGSDALFLINADGGEAELISEAEFDFSNFVISEDDKFIVAEARTQLDDKEYFENWTKKELPLCEARTIDRLLFRQWNTWLGDERNQLFKIDFASGVITNLIAEDIDVPPVSLTSNHDFDVSPDGLNLCYVANIDSQLAVSTNHDLFVKDLLTDVITKITSNLAKDSQPHYSPDGNYIAFTSMNKPGYESDTEVLTLYNTKSGEIERITDSIDISVEEIVWSDDSRYLFFNALEKGRCNIYRSDLQGNLTQLTYEGYDVDIQVSSDENFITFARSFNHMPYEIFKLDLQNNEVSQLTNFNKNFLEEIDLPVLEDFWFIGAEGDSVHGFIQRPPNFDSSKKYPVILTIHGGPQNMWADRLMTRWFTFPLISSPGYVGVFINPRGSSGYGAKFREEVSRDYGGRCYTDLMNGLDYVIENYDFVDEERQAAIGGSFGGYMVNWIIGHTDRFKCVVSHASLYNLISFYGATEELWFPAWDMGDTPWTDKAIYEKWSPHNYAQNFSTPTLVTHGLNDFRVPFAESLQLFTALRRQGVDSRLVVFPDDAHVIYKSQNNVRWWKEIHLWFEKYLKGFTSM